MYTEIGLKEILYIIDNIFMSSVKVFMSIVIANPMHLMWMYKFNKNAGL